MDPIPFWSRMYQLGSCLNPLQILTFEEKISPELVLR